MNTQKIQTSTNVKGFTLVELIVVITILVILGTIAFLNLGGMSASARDSQRTSDLTQINQQVMTLQAKSGVSFISMVFGTGVAFTGANISIAGTGVSLGVNYTAGDANYTVLGVDATKMSDPTSAGLIKYKMGATSLAGGAYELAAKLEETPTALVMGTYRPRLITQTASPTSTGSNTLVLSVSDAGKFYNGDTIVNGGTYTGTITSLITGTAISIGTTSQVAGTGTISLAASETLGLIRGTGSVSDVVANKKGILPY